MNSRIVVASLLFMALSGCVDELPGFHDEQAAHEHTMAGNQTGSMEGHGMESAGHEAMGGQEEHGHHDQSGMERPAFGPAKGRVPTAEEAANFEQVSSFRIIGDEGFRPATGIRSGNGSMEDPYIIEHWYVAGDLFIQDTDACFIVRETYIGGQLSLNWNGICSQVHHNYIYDLRVNENIRRTGYATGGLLEHNEIGYVGQLRHYDGEFRYNEVGPMPPGGPFDAVLETVPFGFAKDPRIANIDGFNQGLIHHNTFHGSVDLDFHGHHHGTGFFAPHSHYHGDTEERKMPHDHTERWTSVSFEDNLIIDAEGYGLRYDDRGHAGDDRVANSEQEKTLSLDHFHRSQIDIRRNVIDGSGLWVDIYNADDANHAERNDGWLNIEDNELNLVGREQGPFGIWGAGFDANSAMRIFTAKEAEIVIRGNTMSYTPLESSGPLAIIEPVAYPVALDLDGVRDAHITVEDNRANGFHTGVRAGSFDSLVSWALRGNDWGEVKVPLDADDTVPMPDE